MTVFLDWLEHMDACTSALDWVRDNEYPLEDAWHECHVPSWMIWLVLNLKIEPLPATRGFICGLWLDAVENLPRDSEERQQALDILNEKADRGEFGHHPLGPSAAHTLDVASPGEDTRILSRTPDLALFRTGLEGDGDIPTEFEEWMAKKEESFIPRIHDLNLRPGD